jgi:ABC-type polysaccharide/polyol phosphate export permease
MAEDLRQILSDLWMYRELLQQLTLRDIKIRYKQAVMGFAWAVFMPMFVVGAGLIIRLVMADEAGAALDAAVVAGLAVKSLPWAFFVGAVGMASSSLTGNASLVTKVYFPREALPLGVVLAQAMDLLIGAAVLLPILPFLGLSPSWQQLWVLPLTFLLLLFTSGVALFLACANLFFRDVKYIVQVLLTFGIFVTPVLYEASMLGGRGSRLVMVNPLSPLLEGIRLSVVSGQNLLERAVVTGADGGSIVAWDPSYLAYAVAVTVVTFLVSAILFHRSEFAFAEHV